MIKLTVPGKPIAKKRPRFARRGKFVTTYSDQETEEGKFIAQVLHQIDGSDPITGPVFVCMVFHMPRPKSHFGTGKNSEIIKSSAPTYPVVKPDLDNLEKFVFDCLNGIAWEDDKQVVESKSRKIYSDTPKTEIRIFKA